jgi:DegV family protein with EDD domain
MAALDASKGIGIMARLRIITDATAYLDPETVARYQITVLPIQIRFGDETFLIGPGDNWEPLFRKMIDGPAARIEASIPPHTIREAYEHLQRETDQILAIMSSGKLSQAFATATAEARAFLGRSRIVVTDSMSTSWGLGLVVKAAAQAAAAGKSLDETVRLVRGLLPHIYVVFCVERLDYLEQGGRIGQAQALLGTMLRIKPLLIVEEGEIIPLEKVRTWPMVIDKLASFVEEFASIQQVVLLRSPLGNDGNELKQELLQRLRPALPNLKVPSIEYDPVLACHLGPEALGVTVYEGF